MKYGLNIPPSGTHDLISLGALVHRLDPGIIPFRKATACQIHVSGGEFNVAANLSDCFRLKTGIASAMVDYPIGDLIAERVRAMGVRPFFKIFKHDGVNGPNMATVYSDRGHGVRGPVVFYNRCNEAAAQLKSGDFNWKEIFAGGVRWFHSGGIFAALSSSTAEVIIEAMQAAKAAGAIISFDLNYRAKLWEISGDHGLAVAVLDRIVKNVEEAVSDILNFYKVYHSARWVREEYVMRLCRRLPDKVVADLNEKFADILRTGRFVQGTALRQEKNEPESWELPRLIFTPYRRNFGRFRQLIDAINAAPPA